MNATLRQNTIARIERHGFTVRDTGGKKYPHMVTHTWPGESSIHTVRRSLNDDGLYDFADTLDALDYSGRLTKVEP